MFVVATADAVTSFGDVVTIAGGVGAVGGAGAAIGKGGPGGVGGGRPAAGLLAVQRAVDVGGG